VSCWSLIGRIFVGGINNWTIAEVPSLRLEKKELQSPEVKGWKVFAEYCIYWITLGGGVGVGRYKFTAWLVK